MLHVRIFILFLIASAPCFSQDKIVLISGIVLEGKVLENGTDTIRFQVEKKRKTTERLVESYRVFSIQYENGNEEVIYKYDSATANDRTEEELRNFIAGEQDAMRGYTPYFASVAALALAGTGAFFIHNFLVFAVPFLTYTIVVFIAPQRLKNNAVRDPNLLGNPNYIDGYMRIVKNKKNRNALWGSIIGTGTGLLVYALSQSGNDF